MTREVKATAGAGQARARCVQVNGWAVVKYAALTVAGVILFRAGAAYALAERGYKAIGGEVFALLLPLLYYVISEIVRDWVLEFEEESGGGGMTPYRRRRKSE